MTEAPTAPLAHDMSDAAYSHRMKGPVLLAIVTAVALLAFYYETSRSMVSIWNRSDTFAHCYLIVPISAWLIWRRRDELKMIDSHPNPWALTVLVGLGFGWVLASLAHVLVFQQYFLVAMIPVSVWSILGTRLAAAIAFPLGYLLLAVPFGEVFTPTLINFTADFTVAALQLTGIPIYREGAYFSLPSGNWSVVEACSGLRYLIASFTLGTLYAYLTYKNQKRRLIFSAMSLVVPVIANGVRAYIIVLVGHFSGMTLAVGADHLIYGWLFFGLVMLLLFWLGALWREDEEVNSGRPMADTGLSPHGTSGHDAAFKTTARVAAAALAISLIWPSFVHYIERAARHPTPASALDIAPASPKWNIGSSELTHWRPVYVGEPSKFVKTYNGASGTVSIYIARYHNQRRESQLITGANTPVTEHDREWRNVGELIRNIDLGTDQLTVRQNQLHSPAKKILLWRWYRLGTEETSSPQTAKIILAKNRLLGRVDEGAEIILAAQYEDKPEEAATILTEFLRDMLPAIRKGMNNVPAR